jgi:flagellar protein FliO/FliZ
MAGDSLDFVMEGLHKALPVDTLLAEGNLGMGASDFLLRLFLAVLVGAICLFLVHRFRHATASNGASPLKVLAAQSLGPRQRVVLLKAGSKTLLIGLGDSAPSCLAEFSPEEAEAFGTSTVNDRLSFQKILSGFLPSTKVPPAEGGHS